MALLKQTINYDIHKNPQAAGQAASYHPRVAEHRVVSTTDLFDEYLRPSQASDLRMLLPRFFDALKEELRCGNTVHIDGLGTFSPTLAADVTLKKNTSRGEPFVVENLRVDGIAFRPEKQLKEALQENINFRYDPQIKGQYVPADYYEPFFTDFFRTPNTLLSRADVRQLLGIEDYPAKRLLQKLVADGCLIPVGGRGSDRYLPAPGHFGR